MKSLTALTLLSASCFLQADEVRMRNIENRLTSLEQGQNTYCTVNPSARPFNPDCWGFYVNIDPLIWQAHVGGTALGIQTNGSTDFFNDAEQSRVKNLSFDWDWGFRLGLGLNLNHDSWDVLLQWTRWRTDASQSFTADANQANYPRIGHPDILARETAGTISSNWELDYDTLDFELSRPFWVSKCVALRPFGGLRSAWINQKDFNTQNTDLSDTAISFVNVDQRDRFWGIGIRGGLDAQWGLGCGFSIFNGLAGNLLYSYHSVTYKQITGDNENSNTGNFSHYGSAIFDMQIGLRYDWFSCDCCYHLGLDLGWEHHWYPNQNQFLFFVDDIVVSKFVVNQGDLGIQGYFLKLRFDF